MEVYGGTTVWMSFAVCLRDKTVPCLASTGGLLSWWRNLVSSSQPTESVDGQGDSGSDIWRSRTEAERNLALSKGRYGVTLNSSYFTSGYSSFPSVLSNRANQGLRFTSKEMSFRQEWILFLTSNNVDFPSTFYPQHKQPLIVYFYKQKGANSSWTLSRETLKPPKLLEIAMGWWNTLLQN